MRKIVFAVLVALVLSLFVARSSYAYCAVENPLTGGCLVEGM